MDFITQRAERWFRETVSDAMPNERAIEKWVTRARRKHPRMLDEDLARVAVDSIKWKVWLVAVLAGLFSNPLFCVLLAWVETKAVIKWQVETTAKVAAILDPTSLVERAEFEADVLDVMMPRALDPELEGAAKAMIRSAAGDAGTHIAKHGARIAIRQVVAKDTLKLIKRFAIRYLGVKVTQRAILSKAVPIVGILVGVILNHRAIEETGRSAIGHYLRKRAERANDVEIEAPTP